MKSIRIASTTAVLVLLLTALIAGCGDDYTDFTHNAPYGSFIVFDPISITFTDVPPVPGEVIKAPVAIVVTDQFNRPMNGINLVIDGFWAFPNGLAAYYFSDETHPQLPAGFTGTTNAAGVYKFTINIPSSQGTGTVSFTDTIHASSGAISGKMDLKMND
jgi:hypothetical protein